ncbi:MULTISPECIES: sensor histidine kinase [unclassified Dietzia]|uniref:sensor histidine kinase n=1 Tax=unclassified Dietzia TaxID=2617939 RepID=UPI0015F920A3|nr:MULTISPECIES: HAMP domain-containing sensor histidine kinase [unclassified Dietzia]MBB1024605.1 HAMP domain-containing histidine kinase [Dietzia sp. DQ12-76]MBB1029157.1 HAMP domain-containing histidine kinase [Dietzia sp. DQ11-38-2]
MAGVVVGCAGSAWLVASVLAPEIFHDHLGQAGIDHDSAEAAHVEEAFTDSIVLALGLAVGVAVLLALLASWYLTRRVQRSVAVVTTSTVEIAGGRYDTRVASPELGREFDDLATSVNELARRLGATDTSRRRMLADLGHEMRTPLATIDSYLEAVEDGVRDYDDDTREVLWRATRRLERLASDIVAVSAVEEHLTRLHPVPTTVAGLVGTATDAARERFADKGVELTARELVDTEVTVDIDRMGQVLGNLLDNALRHTPAGGTVTVSTGVHDTGLVSVTVTDTGEGVAAHHLDHLFDRFYRVDTARGRHSGGSGIGLTITRALVEAHGGRVSAASDGPGHGSRFTVTIPASSRG